MSVVVRMEMPENCECCPMVFTADVPGYHWCAALEQEVEQGLSRPKDCPIICSLPEGHGRLVDESDVIRLVNKWFDTIGLNPDIMIDGIKSLPTIVPADTAERSEA